MTVVDRVRRFYQDNSISAVGFDCPCWVLCAQGRQEFIPAREAYIGRRYEVKNHTVPRLLFLGIDPGNGYAQDHGLYPERYRTIERVRELDGRGFERIPAKNRHWRQVHIIACDLLSQFNADISISSVHQWFASTNAALCTLNFDDARQDHKGILYGNHQKFTRGEIEALKPDVLLTLGKAPGDAVRALFKEREHGERNGCSYECLFSNGRQILWFEMKFPSGRPNRWREYMAQYEQCIPVWTGVLGEEWAGRLTG